MKNVQGFVYLLCFADTPYRHAKHYLGWGLSLSARLADHGTGNGARLTQVLKQHGIHWELSRVWRGDRFLERQLKQRGHTRKCTICRLNKEVIPVHKDWRTDAACAPGTGVDPEIFFPVGEVWRPAMKLDRDNMRQAKAVCWGCPVASECLTSALAAGDGYAIAGGMTPAERKALTRQAA